MDTNKDYNQQKYNPETQEIMNKTYIPNKEQPQWLIDYEEQWGLDNPIQTFKDHDDFLLIKDFIQSILTQYTKEIMEKKKWELNEDNWEYEVVSLEDIKSTSAKYGVIISNNQ